MTILYIKHLPRDLCTVSKVSTDLKNEAVVEEFINKTPKQILGYKNCTDAENKTRSAEEKWLSEDSCNICWCTGETLLM